MSGIEIIPCTSLQDLKETSALAGRIWHEYFPFLLEDAQIDYMVEKFQSFDAMQRQVEQEQYRYYQVWLDSVMAGFIGLQFQKEKLFLSKLYLAKEFRGQGLASEMLAFVEDTARQYGYDRIWLTCNKYNTHSLEVYARKGFETVDAAVTDIGNGYVMDDYFLEKQL